MPEGPSIVILKQETERFKRKKVLVASGNRKLDLKRLEGLKVVDFKTWGKHFLICFKDFTVKIHLLLFGTYRINEKKETEPRLHLEFSNGELNFYACSISFLEGDINEYYEWSADVMSDEWNPRSAMLKLDQIPDKLICDALLDQEIFAGVGNIIKNEVLYIKKVHPESKIGSIPKAMLKAIVKEARGYSFDFLRWKKEFTLRDHWLAHRKTICKRCKIPLSKKNLGVTKRMAYYCNNCQVKYE